MMKEHPFFKETFSLSVEQATLIRFLFFLENLVSEVSGGDESESKEGKIPNFSMT